MRLWIKDPLAILAADAERGVVVEGERDRRMHRARPIARNSRRTTFNASRHVVLPGLINAHHHFYQTLTRAHPAGFGKELIPWLVSMERDLGPQDARGATHRDPDGADRTDAVGLHDRGRSSQSLSPEADERNRHRGRRGDEAWHAHDGHARIHGHFREGRGLQPDSIVQDAETILRTASGCCASTTMSSRAR